MWETISEKTVQQYFKEITERMSVPGGWIVKVTLTLYNGNTEVSCSVSTTFVSNEQDKTWPISTENTSR